MGEGKQKKRQSKNRSCIHKGMVYEAENLSWNYTKPVKKIPFETQHCAILVSARSNQNVSRRLKCLKHEDTYWPIQYLRGKKNYGKIFSKSICMSQILHSHTCIRDPILHSDICGNFAFCRLRAHVKQESGTWQTSARVETQLLLALSSSLVCNGTL